MKRTKRLPAKKLTLAREIVRSLERAELQEVVGGASSFNTCAPCDCAIDSHPC